MTSERHKLWIFLVLLYAITFVAEYKGACVKVLARAHELATARVASLEHIPVGDGTNQIDGSLIIFNSVFPNSRNHYSVVENPYLAVGRDKGNATYGFPNVNLRQFWQRFYDGTQTLKNLGNTVQSGGLATIPQDHFKLRNAVFCVPVGTNGEYIGLKFLPSGTATRQDLPNERYQLQNGDDGQNSGEKSDPFIRRFWIFAIGYIGGFFLILRGAIWIQDGYGGWRGWFGWIFIGLGSLGGVGGPFLWFLEGFPSTWRWPI